MKDHVLMAPSALRMGDSVWVKPLRQGIPRGHKLDPIPEDGRKMQVNDYVLGMAKRGFVLCFKPCAVQPETHQPDEADPC